MMLAMLMPRFRCQAFSARPLTKPKPFERADFETIVAASVAYKFEPLLSMSRLLQRVLIHYASDCSSECPGKMVSAETGGLSLLATLLIPPVPWLLKEVLVLVLLW